MSCKSHFKVPLKLLLGMMEIPFPSSSTLFPNKSNALISESVNGIAISQ